LRQIISSPEVGVFDPRHQSLLLAQSLELLNIYYDSALCQMLKTARRLLPEAHYTMFVAGGSAQEKRADLVFLDERDNWNIVEFKTDTVAPDTLPAKLREHRVQIVKYTDDFLKLSGHQAKGWLYFACPGELEPIEQSEFVQAPARQLKLPLL
jgi:hypothetical protein